MKLFKLFCKLNAYLFFCQYWAALLHIFKPIPAGNLTVNFSKEVFSSFVLLKGLLFFMVAQLLIFLAFTSIQWLISQLIILRFKLTPKIARNFAIGLWFLTVFTVFLANQIYFPWSIFALPTNYFLIKILLKFLFIVTLIILAITVLLALFSLRKIYLFSMLGVCGLLYILTSPSHLPANFKSSPEKPNILILGIDSLRPDYTGVYRTSGKTFTPNIDKFLREATLFPHAFSPLARTFPAWISLLTGEYPKNNGVRCNLSDVTKLPYQISLPNFLRQVGYTTIFSTDDAQFNTLTKELGFEEIFAPQPGFNNFILSTFNDLPFANLLINTQLGKWFFPYSYANRAASATYKTDTYVAYLEQSLRGISKKPIFLAIHLTLPHWPFNWADVFPYKFNSEEAQIRTLYQEDVIGVDQQFGKIIASLAKTHFFDHSIVIVLSDHGQGQGLPAEQITQKNFYIGKPITAATASKVQKPTWGHGTDLLNLTQFNILLGFRQFGTTAKFTAGIAEEAVSLLDIKPTLMRLLGLNSTFDGISLQPWLSNPHSNQIKRNIFFETGFTSEGLAVAKPNIQQLLAKGLNYYRINPSNGFLTIKPEMLKLIIAGKERAVLNYPWMLVQYPLAKHQSLFILTNLAAKQWTCDFTSEFAKQGQVKDLMKALKDFYGVEI